MLPIIFLTRFWLQLLLPSSVPTSSKIVVDLGYASYQGLHSYPNTMAHLGIPYAEPPVGDRRFRAPAPLNTSRITEEAHSKVVDATVYPNFCIQGTTRGVSILSDSIIKILNSIQGGDAGGAGSEDCLKVNIYTPYGLGSKAKDCYLNSIIMVSSQH